LLVTVKRFRSVWVGVLSVTLALVGWGGRCAQARADGQALKPAALVKLDPLRGGQYAIVVDKATQQLSLYGFENGRFRRIEQVPCSTGKVRGDKQKSGDQKTPEGAYFFTREILDRDLAPLYGSGAFPLDYPNFRDKKAGRNGYAIWLHGTNRPLKARDSNGCIAVRNADLDRLKPFISLQRTPIVIQDRMQYDTETDAVRQTAQIKRFLSMWNAALQKGSYHEYLSFYAPEYLPDISWWPKWREERDRAGASVSATPETTVEGAIILKDGDIYTVLFDRYMRLGAHRQYIGAQKLYVALRPDGLKIVGDVFQAPSTDLPAKREHLLLAGVQKLELAAAKEAEAIAARQQAAVKQAETIAARQQSNGQQSEPVAKRRPGAGKQGESIPAMVAGWLKAWSSKDLKRYGSYYHRGFVSQGMNKRQWLAHKARLNKKYRSISVSASDLRIDQGRDRSTVSFIQNYRSNVYRALGIKTLILRREGDRWKIFRESWKKRSSG